MRGRPRTQRHHAFPSGGLQPKRRLWRMKRGCGKAAARLPWPNGPGNRMPQRGQEVSRPKAVTDEGATTRPTPPFLNPAPGKGGTHRSRPTQKKQRFPVGAAAYPKGTCSGSRSYLAGRHWRPAARTPADLIKGPLAANGHRFPRRGGAYPKGTGSTYRSCFAVCRWRCSALFSSIARTSGGAEPRPYARLDRHGAKAAHTGAALRKTRSVRRAGPMCPANPRPFGGMLLCFWECFTASSGQTHRAAIPAGRISSPRPCR